MERPLDNSPEARLRRITAWQWVLPKVVEWECANPLDAFPTHDPFIDNIDNVTDLNANVVNLDDYRHGDEAA